MGIVRTETALGSSLLWSEVAEERRAFLVASSIAGKQGAADGAALLLSVGHCIGCPYLYGGNLPSTGLDCSALTRWLREVTWPRLGLMPALSRPMQRRAIQQGTQSGYPVVSPGQLQRGDLAVYQNGGVVCHVNIVIGEENGWVWALNASGRSYTKPISQGGKGQELNHRVKLKAVRGPKSVRERGVYWQSGFVQFVRPQ